MSHLPSLTDATLKPTIGTGPALVDFYGDD